MDDLTTLKGVGKAADKKLRAAGLDSFAKLAAATPDQLNAAQVAGSRADWSAIIAAAAEKVTPAQQREMTDDEVAALVRAWDDARAELNAAGEAVASIQYQIDTAEAGTVISLFETQLTEAKGRVASAQAAIEALTPLPEGLRLPNAKTAEIPAGSQPGGPVQPGNDAQAPDTHSTSESDRDGEAGNVASLTQANFAPMVAEEVGRVGDYVRALAATDLTAALVQLNDERRRAQLMVRMATSIDAELAQIETELTRTCPAWPLTPIRIYGAEQPIGQRLMLEPAIFARLEAAGAVSGKAPD